MKLFEKLITLQKRNFKLAGLSIAALTTIVSYQNCSQKTVTVTNPSATFAQSPNNGSSGRGPLAASFNNPSGIAVDANDNVYVADTYNHIIRHINAAGVVTTLAGTSGVAGSADGTGTSASFNFPYGVAVDSAGNVFVADSYNNTIRKINPEGVVTTLAGTAGRTGAVDGTGNVATFNLPIGIAVDINDNVLVADTFNGTIRKINSEGVVTTLAGKAGVSGSSDGNGAAASFNFPFGVAVDATGTVFVADSGNNTIRSITSSGTVTTLAGTAGVLGFSDGVGAAASFDNPHGITVDPNDNVYVADADNSTIRIITKTGIVTTFAGTAGALGSADGTGVTASFNNAHGVAVDSNDNVFVADTGNDVIRSILSSGLVSTLAGTPGLAGAAD